MSLQETTEQEIRSHAEECFPNECCGLIAVVKGKERYFRCENKSSEPGQQFIISDADRAAVDEQGEIIAVVHSHPNEPARPSMADKVSCEESELTWYIVHVSVPDGGLSPEASEIYRHDPSNFAAPLIGRPFVHGVLDCYALIRDYYELEMGVTLPNFPRDNKWWEKGQTLYMDHFAECGFEPVKGEIKPGDVILMQSRSPTPNHAAIYIGNTQILHHFYSRLSGREVYGGYWREITRMVIRKVR